MKDLSYAYAEVLEVLKYISLEEYRKISKKFIDFLNENANENSEFKYNLAIPFEKQEISDEAKSIIAIIDKVYFKK